MSTTGHTETASSKVYPAPPKDAKYFSIPDLAQRWRGAVYNAIRGERVLDFAAPGRRGRNSCRRMLCAGSSNG